MPRLHVSTKAGVRLLKRMRQQVIETGGNDVLL